MKYTSVSAAVFVTLMATACSNPNFKSATTSVGDDSATLGQNGKENSSSDSTNGDAPNDLPGSTGTASGASGSTGTTATSGGSSNSAGTQSTTIAEDPAKTNPTTQGQTNANGPASSNTSQTNNSNPAVSFSPTDGKVVNLADGLSCRITTGKDMGAQVVYMLHCETPRRATARYAHWDANFFLKVGEVLPAVSQIASVSLDTVAGDDEVQFVASSASYKCSFDGRQAICPMGFQGHPNLDLTSVAKQNAAGMAAVLKIDDIMGDQIWGSFTLKVTYNK